MARVKILNLVYHYGDTLDGLSVVWKDANETPINLAGYTATLRVKSVAGAGTGQTTLLVLSGGDGLDVDAPNGKISLNATPTKMTTSPSALVQGEVYFYDLQVKNVQETKTLLKGTFAVDKEVTTD